MMPPENGPISDDANIAAHVEQLEMELSNLKAETKLLRAKIDEAKRKISTAISVGDWNLIRDAWEGLNGE